MKLAPELMPADDLEGQIQQAIRFVQNEGFASFSGVGVILVNELLGNILYFVFMLLILVQFLKKRSSLPRLVVIYLVFDIVFRGLDIAGSQILIEGQWVADVLNEELRNLGSAFFSALIWIPYFTNSKRVRRTFINRVAPAPATSPPARGTSPAPPGFEPERQHHGSAEELRDRF